MNREVPSVAIEPAKADALSNSTRSVLLSASLWVLFGYNVDRLLHFVSHVITARLLNPEAVGVMALVSAVLHGLTMLSDVGLRQSVIQNERGEDPEFLNTAWTVQAVRGLILWACASALAWPAALWYGQPVLAKLVPFTALSAVLAGFTSTSFLSMNRRLQLRRLEISLFAGHAFSVVTTILLVWLWRSVWGLAAGAVAGAAFRLAISYVVAEGLFNRLSWDREAARSMFRFGRWIFLSTLLTFFMTRGDRLILGSFMPIEQLGLYAVAAFIARTIFQNINTLSQKVLLPFYSRIASDSTVILRRRVARVRLVLMAVMLPPLWFLAVWGDWLVDVLYDDRYLGAGWMLRVLAGGSLFTALGMVGPIHLARGESYIGLVAVMVRGAAMLGAMIVAGSFAGSSGLVWAIAASHVVNYPLQVWISRRYRVWFPRLDALGIISSAGVLSAGALLR